MAALGFNVLTLRTQNSWALTLAPPVILVGLVFVPSDLTTAHIWLGAYFVVLASAFSVFVRGVALLRSRARDTKLPRYAKPIAFVRPVLCIIAVVCSSKAVRMSEASANMRALELAYSANDYLSREGICPAAPEGWEPDSTSPLPEAPQTLYGKYGTEYRIAYQCAVETSQLEFLVRINQDVQFSVAREADGGLSARYGHYANPVFIRIDDTTDLKALARMDMN